MKKLITEDYSGIYGYLRNPEIGTGMRPEDRMVEYLKTINLTSGSFWRILRVIIG